MSFRVEEVLTNGIFMKTLNFKKPGEKLLLDICTTEG